MGDYARAIEYYLQQLTITREIGDRRGESNALANMGNAYKGPDEVNRAVEFFHQQLLITRLSQDRRGEGNALWNVSRALDELGQRVQAITHAEAALKICTETEDPLADQIREQLADWQGSNTEVTAI